MKNLKVEAAQDYVLPLNTYSNTSIVYVADGIGNVMDLGYYSDAGTWTTVVDGSLESGKQYKIEHGYDLEKENGYGLELIIKCSTYSAVGHLKIVKFN